jgi:uncharacterized protein (DUF1501 family)
MKPSRRRFFTTTASGMFALSLRHSCSRLFAATPSGPVKRCVVLWMGGGPSQLETFDPKPGQTTGGPTTAIETSAPGISIAANLPEIAKRMDRLSVIRNLSSPEGDHDRGQYLLHTGYPLIQAFPRPTLGSVISHESAAADFPMFVSVGATGLGPAYMGPDHAPFAVQDPAAAVRLIAGLRRQRRSMKFLDEFSSQFDATHAHPGVDRRRATLQKMERMLTTPFVSALDIDNSPQTDRDRYGDSEFGRRCLLARRLLEAGVRFVEVQHDGWDTHSDNFNAVANLCGGIDRPWSTLIDDLQASGLWNETLVVWMGEFGRTPQINADTGRDHFPNVTPVVLGGGGLRGGVAVGRTNATGLEIDGDKVTVPDLFATLMTAMGLDPAYEFRTEFGAVAKATEDGKPIAALL